MQNTHFYVKNKGKTTVYNNGYYGKYMYFLWAKINMASYGHTMFSLKLLILIVIRQCIMACFKTNWWRGWVGLVVLLPQAQFHWNYPEQY